MAVLYITEYEDLARDSQGNILMMGKEPAVATQAVTFTTTTASAAFSGQTNFVHLTADAACHIAFALSPTATTSNTKRQADFSEFFGVRPSLKVAAVTA